MTQPSPSALGHVRLTVSLLARPEQAFVRWILPRIPARITPDDLTAVGIAGSLLVFAGYVLSNLSPAFLWLASVGLGVNWFGDTIDGNLARFRKMERPRYGFFLDHSVDSISMLLVFTGLGLSPYLEMDIALLWLVSYLLLSIFVYLDTLVNGTFQIVFAWIGPTEGRLLLLFSNMAMLLFGRPKVGTYLGDFHFYDLAAGLAATALFLVYAVMVMKRLRQLTLQDPAGSKRAGGDSDGQQHVST